MFDLQVTPITSTVNILHLIENDLVDTQFLTCVPIVTVSTHNQNIDPGSGSHVVTMTRDNQVIIEKLEYPYKFRTVMVISSQSLPKVNKSYPKLPKSYPRLTIVN